MRNSENISHTALGTVRKQLLTYQAQQMLLQKILEKTLITMKCTDLQNITHLKIRYIHITKLEKYRKIIFKV